MGLIQRADLPERIRRAFGVRERGIGQTISPEIVPVALVDDLTGPAIDEGYPRFCYAYASAGASAGVFSEVFLINPTGSVVDVVVQELQLLRGTTGTANISEGLVGDLNNMLGTQILRTNLDLRVNQFPNAYVDSRNQAAIIGTRRTYAAGISNSVFTDFPMQWTIPPGAWLSASPVVNNLAMTMQVYWYERLRTTT